MLSCFYCTLVPHIKSRAWKECGSISQMHPSRTHSTGTDIISMQIPMHILVHRVWRMLILTYWVRRTAHPKEITAKRLDCSLHKQVCSSKGSLYRWGRMKVIGQLSGIVFPMVLGGTTTQHANMVGMSMDRHKSWLGFPPSAMVGHNSTFSH
jgi:hypothetical protein